MSPKEDIGFLKAFLKKLQKNYQNLSELCYPQDFQICESDTIPATGAKAERTARLADANGFDGSLFRNTIPNNDDDPTSQPAMRHLKEQIETIPRIIAKIEESNSTERRWDIEKGKVFFNGDDLQFPTGKIQDVLKRLVCSQPLTVTLKEFEDEVHTQPDQCRHYIMNIR
ncbi:MAG: hypothetical protein WC389_14250, partial [Lutibacter sp.]